MAAQQDQDGARTHSATLMSSLPRLVIITSLPFVRRALMARAWIALPRSSSPAGSYSGTSTILIEPSPFFILSNPAFHSDSGITSVTTPSVGRRPSLMAAMVSG